MEMLQKSRPTTGVGLKVATAGTEKLCTSDEVMFRTVAPGMMGAKRLLHEMMPRPVASELMAIFGFP